MIKNIKTTKDVFDLSDVSDLPPEIVDQLVTVRRCKKLKELLTLFDISTELRVSEVLAGMYRKYGKIYKRTQVVSLCYRACGLHLLRKRGRGRYVMTSKGKDYLKRYEKL